jgi:hypothetical protein
MTISDQNMQKLQAILKDIHGVELDNERAHAAGRAILRLVGIKLYQVFEKEMQDEESSTISRA